MKKQRFLFKQQIVTDLIKLLVLTLSNVFLFYGVAFSSIFIGAFLVENMPQLFPGDQSFFGVDKFTLSIAMALHIPLLSLWAGLWCNKLRLWLITLPIQYLLFCIIGSLTILGTSGIAMFGVFVFAAEFPGVLIACLIRRRARNKTLPDASISPR